MRFRVIFAFMLSIIVASCSDVVIQRYATYEEAQQQGVFARGWLPEILPASSSDIATTNNLDLNTSEGAFKIDMKDYDKFVALLQPLDEANKYYYIDMGSKWVFTIYSNGKVTYQLQQL